MKHYMIIARRTPISDDEYLLDRPATKAEVFAKAAELAKYNGRVQIFCGRDIGKLVGDYIDGKFYGPETQYSYGVPIQLQAAAGHVPGPVTHQPELKRCLTCGGLLAAGYVREICPDCVITIYGSEVKK